MNSSFSDIYDKWLSSHNDSDAIAKKSRADNKVEKHEKTIGELRRMYVQDELDLHNTVLEDAIPRTDEFISDSISKGLNKVRIVTGKGLHSQKGEAVLRPAVISFLKKDLRIRELDASPKAVDGGSGAVIVILKNKNQKTV